MTTIFPAAIIPVIVMGVVLEIGKIASVLFLHRHWSTGAKAIRAYLIIAIFVLMFINSIGIFGFLSKAHIEQEVKNQAQTSQVEIVQSKIENEKSLILDFSNQITQIDNNLAKLTEQGKAQTSLSQGVAQRKQRDLLAKQKQDHQTTLQGLTTERIQQDNENAKVRADFGPLTYIADAIYGAPSQMQLEATVRIIIGIIVFVFDPLALVLLIASQYAFQNRKRLTGPSKENTVAIRTDILDWKEGKDFGSKRTVTKEFDN